METLVVLLVILLLATLWDYKHGKIPNPLIIAGIVSGLIRMIIKEDIHGMLLHIPGILLPAIFLYPVFKIGGIGAGDIKLLSVTGFYFPIMQTVYCILISLILGAILSLIKMAYYKNFMERMIYFFSYLRQLLLSGKFYYYHNSINGKKAVPEKKTQIHLAAAVFLSALLVGGVI